jgi:hypothetical protein
MIVIMTSPPPKGLFLAAFRQMLLKAAYLAQELVDILRNINIGGSTPRSHEFFSPKQKGHPCMLSPIRIEKY